MNPVDDPQVGETLVLNAKESGYNWREVWAVVEKVSDSGWVTLRVPGSGNKPLVVRPSRFGRKYVHLRRPTAHEVATREWRARVPTLKVASLHDNLYGRRDREPTHVRLYDPVEFDKIGDLIRDLEAVRQWLSERPVDLSEIDQ